MRILHVGADITPFGVNGVNSLIWQLARQQAELGHDVALLLTSRPHPDGIRFARDAGIALEIAAVSRFSFDLDALRQLPLVTQPTLVNLHSAFIPQHVTLARWLRRCGVPYVITPSGGVDRQVIAKHRIKKQLFTRLWQGRYFRHAGGIVVNLPQEEVSVRSYQPDLRGLVRWIPNPVDPDLFAGDSWQGQSRAGNLVYLGRLDVFHKGLDILAGIAAALPGIDFHLYGHLLRADGGALDRLRASMPSNFHIHEPVFGEEKRRVLIEASGYIQTSRWESFGISIAEAMSLGVPCFVSETLALASLIASHDLGCVLSADPLQAADQLRRALSDQDQLCRRARQARTFSTDHFYPSSVGAAYVDFYRDVVANASRLHSY